ncbi:hypothetical protein BU23DRAFT_560445, partial [Bimuria novae-zelandiae CBS 107.79]
EEIILKSFKATSISPFNLELLHHEINGLKEALLVKKKYKKKGKKVAKLYKEKIVEEKRVGREAAKVAREKKRKRVVDAVATKEALGAVLVALLKTTRRGRNVKLLSKYK